MNANAVNVAVVDGKTITQTVELSTAKNGQPVRIKAVKGGHYILGEGEKGIAPENITIKRVGKDLHVALEGSDPDQPQLIIEDFEGSGGQLVGIAEDGSYYEYISSDAEEDRSAALLMDGVSSPQVLGAQPLTGFGDGLTAGSGIGWFWPALLGLGALGLLGGIYAANRDDNKKGDGGTGGGSNPDKGLIDGADDNVGDKQGLIENGGSTDDRTPTFTGIGRPGTSVEIIDNGESIGTAIVGDDGKWTYTPPEPGLDDGSHIIVVVPIDAGGNKGEASPGYEVIIDTVAPSRPLIDSVFDDVAPNEGQISSGGFTNDNTPTLSGTGEAGSIIRIYDDGVEIGSTVAEADGTWSFTPDPALAEGPHEFTVAAEDGAGNISVPSLPFPIIVDTIAPVKPGNGTGGIEEAIDNVGPIQGDIGNGGSTDDGTPTFGGGGLQPGDTVTIIDDDLPIGTAIVGEDGRWEFTPDPALSEGPHPITVIVTDPAGNASEPSDPYIVIVDTTPPVKPGIGTGGIEEAIDNVGPIQGDIGNGGSTDDGTPTFGGGGLQPGDTVTIIDDDLPIGTAIVGEDGRWEFTPDPALSEGPHPITVIVTDPAGNASEPSDPYIVIVDTTPPVKPGIGTGGIEEAIDNVGPIQGDIGNGGSTDDGTPTFGGGGLQPGDTVTIIDDDLPIGTAIVGEDGRWEFTPDPALSEGPHPITVIVTDPAGNASEPSDPYIVIVDTTPPVKPGIGTGGIEEAIDNVGPIQGDIGNGGSTDDGTPTFGGGGLQPGDTVTIIDDDLPIGTAIVGEDGRWEFTPDPALSEGPHPITVIVTDPAGNASEPSDPYIIIVDTEVPIAPTIDSVFDDQGSSTGNINPGDTTDDAQPDIGGTAEPGSTVVIYDNGLEIGRVPVGADGSWTYTPVPPLRNGSHNLTAEAVDAAGNTSAPSNAVDFELVTGGTPPAPSIIGVEDDVADNIGNIMPGESTNDTEPAVSGTAEPFSIVTLFANGMNVGSVQANALGDWEITPNPALLPGLNNLTATATNVAGNVSAPTGEYPITVDITPPVAADASQLEDNVGAITGPINSGDTTDDNTPTFSGTAEANTTLIILDNGVEIARVPVDSLGNWSYTPAPPLPNGDYSFSTIVVDAAGNRSPESTAIDFTVDTSTVAVSIEQVLDNVGPIQNPLASGGVTDDTTPTLRGQATPGATVNIYLDNVLHQAGVPVNALGEWEYTFAPALAQGSYVFNASVVTPAGGESPLTADFNLEIDLTAPTPPSIDEVRDDVGDIQGPISDGSTTDDTTPTLVGGGVAGDTIIIRNNGAELDRVIVQPDGSWSFTPNPPLNHGSTNVFDVIAQDPAGNQSAPSAPWTVIIDTEVPIAPTIDSVFDDQGSSTGNINPGDTTDDAQPDIGGTAEPGSTVVIYDNGLEIGRVPVGADGSWTYTPVPPLRNGSHNLTAEAVDAAGNTSAPSNAVDFELVTGGTPPAPSIIGVEDDVADNIGNIMPGESTNDTEPAVSGTAEPFSIVTLFANGMNVGSVQANALGDWEITPNPALLPGLNNLTATATNVAGNVSAPTGEYPITVDITPPVAADASQLEDNVGAITGPINSGDTTDDNTPTFSGTAEANTTLIILDNGVEIARVPVDSLGNWSYTPAPPLPNGDYSFSTIVVDAAGNRSPESTAIDFTVDTSTVAVSIEQVLDNVGPIQNPLASGGVTDDTTPTLRGQATPGATVNIYLDNVLHQAGVPVNALGEWEYTFAPALAQGSYVFNASVVTPAGGESPLTADFNLEIDTTPSAPPSIDEISDDVGTIQGPIADGASTDDTTPTLGGSGEPGDVIIIRNNGTELARVTVQSDGTWSFTPNPPLNHGSTNVFDVIAQDPAGNQSAPSAPWTIVIDTVGPLTTIISVIDDSSGSPVPIGSGESTTDRTPTVNGTSEPDSEISIFNNGELIGTATADASGNWNFTPDMPLNSGSYNLTAISVDPAGNTGPVSNAVDFMIGSVFGSVKGIEDFEGFASNFQLLQGVTHALGSMDITVLSPLTADTWVNIRGSHQVDQVLGFSGVVSPTVQFDLKGETASTLIIHLDYSPSDSRTNEIRFYDAEGSLIHTHLLNAAGPGAQFGVEQVTMPDDLKFSSFQIQINGNVDNIILSDAPILIEEFSALGSFFEFPVDVEVELDLFTITRMKSSHGGSSYMDIRGNDSYGNNKNLQLANGAANFDLQGKLASTLNMHAYFISPGGAAIPGNVEFRFYNAEGELIHTMDPGVLHWKSGWTSYSLPEGMQFASFQIETSQYGNITIDEISFADLMLPDQPPVTETTKTVAQVIEIHEGEEGTVLAEGNAMIDTLMLTGAGQVLDLTVLGDKVSSIEVIDITGTGDNTLNLSLGDVLEQGGTNLFTGDDTTQMMIKGNAGDIVNLDDLLPDGTDPGDWATAGTATVAGVVYNVYQHSTLDAQLLVQDGVTTNLV